MPLKPDKRAEQAKTWRIKAGLDVNGLADRTGFSPTAIYYFERGSRDGGAKHSEFAWQRYQKACAAVDNEIRTGKVFTW